MRFLFSFFLLGSLVSVSTPFVIKDSAKYAVEGGLYDGMATVFFIRDNSGSGMLYPITVKVDGVDKGSLKRESFVHFSAAPGRHDFLAHWNPLTGEPNVAVNAELEANKTYYFVFGTSYMYAGAITRYGASLGLVDGRKGEELTIQYKKKEIRATN